VLLESIGGLFHAIGHALLAGDRDLGFLLLSDLDFRKQDHLHGAIRSLQGALQIAGLQAVLPARTLGKDFT
jgi:hypothetical protein